MQRDLIRRALHSPAVRRDLQKGVVRTAWVLVLLMAVATLARWLRLDDHDPVLAATSTGAPVVLLPAWAVLTAAVAFRRIALYVIALVLCIAQVHVTAPLLHGARGLDAAQRSPAALHLRLMTLNVKYDVDDGARVSAQVRAADPDIVMLDELSPLTLRHLDLSQYPYRAGAANEHGYGFGVWSRWPVGYAFTDYQLKLPFHVGFVQAPGHLLALVQVHTRSPTNTGRAGVWRGQLRDLRRLLQHAYPTTIVAGDFNASRSDHGFAALLGGPGGFADVADGRGLLPTWPSRALGFPPLLRLDHIVVSRTIGVRDARVLGPTGSDHRAVLADLAFA